MLPSSNCKIYGKASYACVLASRRKREAAACLAKIPRAEPVSQRQVCNHVPPLDNLAEGHQDIKVQEPEEWTGPQEQNVIDCLHVAQRDVAPTR